LGSLDCITNLVCFSGVLVFLYLGTPSSLNRVAAVVFIVFVAWALAFGMLLRMGFFVAMFSYFCFWV
jgi:hypothetical protein